MSEPTLVLDPRIDHHPWCNFFGSPRAGCKSCEDKYQRFPIQLGDTFDSLQEQHFPEAELRRR